MCLENLQCSFLVCHVKQNYRGTESATVPLRVGVWLWLCPNGGKPEKGLVG